MNSCSFFENPYTQTVSNGGNLCHFCSFLVAHFNSSLLYLLHFLYVVMEKPILAKLKIAYGLGKSRI